jgi:hypothetical protein
MKRVLSFLLMIVFLHANVSTAFAKRGGPDIGGTQNVDTIGTYAGTMIPIFSTNPANTNSSASIGLFSIGVPDLGLAQGACVIFVDGSAYSGTITGVADPLDGQLQGLIDAISNFVLIDPLNPTIQYRVFATGSIEAEIRETVSFGSLGTLSTLSFATTRLEGEAKVDISQSVDANGAAIVSNTVTFAVDGFKQSSTVQVVSAIPGGGGGGTTP